MLFEASFTSENMARINFNLSLNQRKTGKKLHLKAGSYVNANDISKMIVPIDLRIATIIDYGINILHNQCY